MLVNTVMKQGSSLVTKVLGEGLWELVLLRYKPN